MALESPAALPFAANLPIDDDPIAASIAAARAGVVIQFRSTFRRATAAGPRPGVSAGSCPHASR